jgi:hypothetical protein
MPLSYPSRDLTNQYISLSYQDVVQKYSPGVGDTNEYFLDGLGNVIAIIPSSSVSNVLITSDVTSSMSVLSASFAERSNTSYVSDVSIISETASIAASADFSTSSSWSSASISASYVTNLYPQVEQVSASWASSSISASWALTASYVSNMSGSNLLYLQSTDGNTYQLSLVNYSGSTILTIGQTPVTGTNNFLNIGTISPLITGSTYPITSSWAVNVVNGGSGGGTTDVLMAQIFS